VWDGAQSLVLSGEAPSGSDIVFRRIFRQFLFERMFSFFSQQVYDGDTGW